MASILEGAKRRTLKRAAEYIVTTLRERTRGGDGVEDEGYPETPLKPLSETYIKQRMRFADLSDETDPETSNLTRTGDMLDSLYYRVDTSGLTVSVKGSDNLLKAIYTSAERPWTNLSAQDIETLKQMVREEIDNNKGD